MSANRRVLNEVPFSNLANRELVEFYADTIRPHPGHDLENPEWPRAPIVPLDLTERGGGIVSIMNEADVTINPSGTFKERAVHEVKMAYGQLMRSLLMNGFEGPIALPRVTILSYGNHIAAFARQFEEAGLPPPKALLPTSLPKQNQEILKGLRADSYLINLNHHAFVPEEILEFTNNVGGIDITSVMSLEPQADFYDWMSHYVLNELADDVYVPHGSGMLFQNILSWQRRSVINGLEGNQDSRLIVPAHLVARTNVHGVTTSAAKMLEVPHSPFQIYKPTDVDALRQFGYTGKGTGIEGLDDNRAMEYIAEARALLEGRGLRSEDSGATGLAKHLQDIDDGAISPLAKALVVNTGCGILDPAYRA